MEVRAKDLNQDVASRKQVNAKEYVQSTPVRQIASISRLQKTGRKRTFTPTRMRNEINKYLSWCEENDRVPSIKGLMIHLKMHKSQFYTYCEYPEFTDLMEQARLVISEWCENDLYHTSGAAAGKIAYMKNIHGWTEKIEQETTRVITVDEAKAKLEMLLPKIMETIKRHSIEQKLSTEDAIVIPKEESNDIQQSV